MDATHIGAADHPDDSKMFAAITSALDIDTDAIETDVAATAAKQQTPELEQSTVEQPKETPPAPLSAPEPNADQERTAAPPQPPPPVFVAPPPPPPPVRPRPMVVMEYEPRRIAPPTKPADKAFRQEKALEWGYRMSIGVGVTGQIASFGGLIAAALPANLAFLAYCAAALGAAFAEITMVGCGAAALKRRYNEGSWKALAGIAWFVCCYATVLNVFHWAPLNIALAVMFGGGSLVGFAAHTVAAHLAARDFEKQLAAYRVAVAEAEAEQQHQADQLHREQQQEYERQVAEQARHRRNVEQQAKKTSASVRPPSATTGTKKTTSKQPNVTSYLEAALQAEKKAGGRDQFGYRRVQREFGLTEPQARHLRKLMDDHQPR